MLDIPHSIIKTDAVKRFWNIFDLLGIVHLLVQVLARYLRKQDSQIGKVVLHQAVVCVETQYIVVIGEVWRHAPRE